MLNKFKGSGGGMGIKVGRSVEDVSGISGDDSIVV